MNDVREIVTRAVLAKGRKKFKLKETVLVNCDISSVLGCWIINHQFETELNNKEVKVIGSFENNIWYSADNNTKTDVARSTTEYTGIVKVKEVLNDNISNHCDVVARILQQPTCTNALITNDGILSHNLLSPKKHVDKTYFLETDAELTSEDIKKIESGVLLDNELTLPAKIEKVTDCAYHLTIHEGKFHQVKRMIASTGKSVTYLKRISFGPLKLDENLKLGSYRLLTEEEINLLKNNK